MKRKSKPLTVIVLGAGSGKRMGSEKNKMFLNLNHIPVLYRTLFRLDRMELIDSIILVCKESETSQIEKLFKQYGRIEKLISIVPGGKERSESVRIGLKSVLDSNLQGIVMTHDGARPFISNQLVTELYDQTSENNIAIPVTAVSETLRKAEKNKSTSVVDRTDLFSVQTPQSFSKENIEECFFRDGREQLNLTDEASYFEKAGKNVRLVKGEKWNIKLTNPDDIKWAEMLLNYYQELKLNGLDS